MSTPDNAERLARAWIQGWIDGRPDDIPLSADFVHTSPFGRIEGRDLYLDKIKPASALNVTKLTIRKTLGGGEEAVIRFDMDTAHGNIPCVDWVTIHGDTITRVDSFYDATSLRGESKS